MIFRNRSEIVQSAETVQLHVTFRSLSTGLPADLAAFPQVRIIQPSGNVMLGPTTAGVYRLSTGVYGYDLAIGMNPNQGVWTDLWQGTAVDGYILSQELKFVVHHTNLPANSTDGYIHLGDDPGFNYSQLEMQNINKMLKALKMRLHSSGKAKSVDQFGQPVYVDCDIYTIEMLVIFLSMSLTEFNAIPHFTSFGWEDTEILNQFFSLIVQGAVIYALASKALIERGREFQITDNGVNFTPPTISELLNTQYSAEMANHLDKVRQVKASMKPAPSGLGTLTVSTSRSPALSRLRHLRSRQLY